MNKRKGFTLIEVLLFLAVTAALFIGIAWGMRSSLFQQQYNDSVQSFLEFMRSIYSKVSNPQSTGTGNTNKAIYGKLVVFGEGTDLEGSAIDWSEDGFPVFVYDVVGDALSASEIGSGDVKSRLMRVNANVVKIEKDTNGSITDAKLMFLEKYNPRWQTVIESANKKGDVFTGSIMVVRHPTSGVINTLVLDNNSDDVVEANRDYNAAKGDGFRDTTFLENILKRYLEDNGDKSFQTKEVDFCVNPYGYNGSGVMPRQNIRILSNARNASSVELIELDGSDNQCNR